MKATFTLIHAYSDEVEVKKESTAYAPNGYVYLMPDKADRFEWARTIYEADKEKNEWIRRYENAMQGLKYWREKALESK